MSWKKIVLLVLTGIEILGSLALLPILYLTNNLNLINLIIFGILGFIGIIIGCTLLKVLAESEFKK